MRAVVTGNVVQVEAKPPYVRPDGTVSESFDAFLRASDPRYAADRISGPLNLMPHAGDDVAFLCSMTAKAGRRGPWLSVWVVEELDVNTLPAGLFPNVAASA
ncbi:MAG: hypothetical protein WCF36_18965 [Candidatus Nanopelagicales bacterium]